MQIKDQKFTASLMISSAKSHAFQQAVMLGGLMLALLSALPAQAQTYVWNGTTNTSWQTPGNWTPSGTPPFNTLNNGRISVENGSNNQLIYTSAEGTTTLSTSSVRGLAIGVSGGTAVAGINGEMTITGGAIISGSTSSGTDFLGQNSTGTLIINGGSYTANDGLEVGFSTGGGVTGTGIFDVESGTASIITAGTLTIGQAANTVGTVNLDGGTLTVKNGIITASTLATSTFNFNGGTLQVVAGSSGIVLLSGLTNAYIKSQGAVIDTNGSSDSISQSLLADTVSTGGGLTKTGGAGTLTLSGTNTYTGATIVNAGILTAGSTQAFGINSAVSLANTSGVSLNLANHNNSIGSLTGGGTTGGGVTLGTATLTVGGDNTSPAAYAGVISGTTGGNIVKTGTGVMTLSGTSTYTGGTTVNQGTVAVTGKLASTGALTVNGANGGTFALGRAAGGASFLNQTVSALTLSSATGLGTEAVLKFDLGSTMSDSISTGALTLSSGQKFNLVLTETAGAPTTNETLLTWTSETGFNSLASIDLTGSTPGITTNDLEIVGNSLIFEAESVPEPSTWALMLGGVAMLVFVQRKRRSNHR